MVKINSNFSKLNASLKQVGAELNFRYHFNNNRSDIALTRSKFNSDGTLSKIKNLKIDYLAGLSFYQNNFVAIYFQNLKADKINTFHFSECNDLLINLEKNESNTTLILPDSEKADLKKKDTNKILSPCHLCLENTNWNNFEKAEDWSKRIIIEQFNILEFHKQMFSVERELVSNFISSDFLKMLPKNFPRILETAKSYKKWTCQKCKINVSGMKQLYHAVILDRTLKRYLPNDFLGLCTGCLKVKYHDMYITPEELDFINEFRPKSKK